MFPDKASEKRWNVFFSRSHSDSTLYSVFLRRLRLGSHTVLLGSAQSSLPGFLIGPVSHFVLDPIRCAIARYRQSCQCTYGVSPGFVYTGPPPPTPYGGQARFSGLVPRLHLHCIGNRWFRFGFSVEASGRFSSAGSAASFGHISTYTAFRAACRR